MGPFAGLRIRPTDQPTTRITPAVRRIDARNTAYGLAGRGEYGPVVQQGVQKSLPSKHPLSAAQKDVIDHLALIRGNSVAPRVASIPQDPAELTRHIKEVAHFLKADLVRTCHVPEWAHYSHDRHGNPIETRYGNAIIIAMRKEWNAVRASTGCDWMRDPISCQAYGHLALVAETMANYIRRLGWEASAQYGPSFVDQYTVLLPPLLLLAGVGEISRAGIVLNPVLGLGFKAAAILTHMPLRPDKPIDFGLQQFCQTCRICALNCPSHAIPTGDKVTYNGYETWKLDTRRCASLNFTNKKGTMCNRCVKSCPWTQPNTWSHHLVRALVTRSRLAGRIALRAAPLLGSARDHPADKWWFDLEYVGRGLESRGVGDR
jgi:reductive dehalogenase